jgi:hypothetical protein
MSESQPVEQKVKAASLASLATSFVVGLIVLEVPFLSGAAPFLQVSILTAITTAATAAAGWLAKHTHRPDLGPAEKTLR